MARIVLFCVWMLSTSFGNLPFVCLFFWNKQRQPRTADLPVAWHLRRTVQQVYCQQDETGLRTETPGCRIDRWHLLRRTVQPCPGLCTQYCMHQARLWLYDSCMSVYSFHAWISDMHACRAWAFLWPSLLTSYFLCCSFSVSHVVEGESRNIIQFVPAVLRVPWGPSAGCLYCHEKWGCHHQD